MARLTEKQRTALLSKINPARVQMLRGMAHLEVWDVRRYMIRIFGHGGYDFEVLETELVHQGQGEKKRDDGSTYPIFTVVYRVTGRLVVKDESGVPIAHWDDGAAGDAINQPSVGDAHDMALKTAMSQAIKRCAVNLGDQFGLSLYNDGSGDPVVKWSLAPDDGDYVREPAAEADPEAEPAPTAEPATKPEFQPSAEAQELMASVNAAAHQGAAKRVWSRIIEGFKAGHINETEANWLRKRFEERGPELPPEPNPTDTPAALEGELIETGLTE